MLLESLYPGVPVQRVRHDMYNPPASDRPHQQIMVNKLVSRLCFVGRECGSPEQYRQSGANIARA